MEPGCYCCYCSYKSVVGMITRNTILYEVPIVDCPTKDNVYVTIDLAITFHIGQNDTREQDCHNFMYFLGPNRLEELLEAETEEATRSFINKQNVNRVRDLKGELT